MKKRTGFILPLLIAVILLFLITAPSLINWITTDTTQTIREQRKSIAFNLAQAAVERGYWKVKSSTSTFEAVSMGQVLSGYNFDVTYNDISGGSYRIKVSSGSTPKEVIIIGEGRDNSTKEVRAIMAVYENRTTYSPILTHGNFTTSQFLCAFWGPIMAQGNYIVTDANAAKRYFPRKFAKGSLPGFAFWPRDTNGPNPPNTDNVEWWSYYNDIPEVPIIDFVTLRSSAAATNTLNRYNLKSEYSGAPCKTTTGPLGGDFSICKKFPNQPQDDSGPNLVWYWDGDLIIEGYEDIEGYEESGCGSYPFPYPANYGFKGTVIVRGNLTLRSYGCYKFQERVPREAYKDHYKMLQNAYDTSEPGEYPADIGFQITKSTFNFGTETFRPWSGESPYWLNTVGIRGFTYVGGNLTIVGPDGFLDFVGAVWVVGNVSAIGATWGAFCGVFYNENLDLPTLNVILIKKSWNEIKPSSIPWS